MNIGLPCIREELADKCSLSKEKWARHGFRVDVTAKVARQSIDRAIEEDVPGF